MGRVFLLMISYSVLAFCSSCRTYVIYPVATPPRIATNGGLTKVALVNMYDYTSLGFSNEEKRRVFADGVRTLIENLEKSFMDDENFSFVIKDSLVKGRALNGFAEIMNSSHIVSLCESVDADMLLMLESFDAIFSTETITEESDDGSKSHTNLVDLVVRARFSIYNNKGEVLDRVMHESSMPYQERSALSGVIVIGPSMGKAGKEVNILAGRLASDYLDNFYSDQENGKDFVYYQKEFWPAVSLMHQLQWKEAIDLMLPMAYSTDPKLARKAAHNIAIAYNALGDKVAYDQWKLKSGK